MTETENLGSQRKNFTDWEAAFGELKARYVKQHKLAVKYKEAFEAIVKVESKYIIPSDSIKEAAWIAREALEDE